MESKERMLRKSATIRSYIADSAERGEMMRAEDASNFLGITKASLYKLMQGKEVPYYKAFGRAYFYKNELAKYWSLIMRPAVEAGN